MANPKATRPPQYDDDIDFEALALQDADFAQVCKDGRVDFQNPKAVQQLTKTLLKRDFGLRLELPDDRLCPPVPVRYNYVRWIQDLLETTSSNYNEHPDPDRQVLGLDIGTGASSIYALLCCATRPGWRMYATDVDSASLSSAENNIAMNELSSRIRLRRSTTDSPLIPLDALGTKQLDFCMCNPPFYSSIEDMTASYDNKSRPPSAVCTGAEVEMICPGGDSEFVLHMVEESRVLGTRVNWYSSMLGKLSSVHIVVARLKEIGVKNWAVTVLRAGRKTKRWAVAWSFGDWRPRNDVARSGDLVQAILPFPTAQTIHTEGLGKEKVGDSINDTMHALDLKWQWKKSKDEGLGIAKENVWSRAARRKQKRQAEGVSNEDGKPSQDVSMDLNDSDADEPCALAFKILVQEGEVEVRWMRGHDSVVFESFCGMLKRALRVLPNS